MKITTARFFGDIVWISYSSHKLLSYIMSCNPPPEKKAKSDKDSPFESQTLQQLREELSQETEKLEVLMEEANTKYAEYEKADRDVEHYRDYVGQLRCRLLMRRLSHGKIVQEEARRLRRIMAGGSDAPTDHPSPDPSLSEVLDLTDDQKSTGSEPVIEEID